MKTRKKNKDAERGPSCHLELRLLEKPSPATRAPVVYSDIRNLVPNKEVSCPGRRQIAPFSAHLRSCTENSNLYRYSTRLLNLKINNWDSLKYYRCFKIA